MIVTNPEDECLLTLTNRHGWCMTACYRTGSPDSLLTRDVSNEDELFGVEPHLRAASWPVCQPCVTVQATFPAIIYSSDQVRALARWLMNAAKAMDEAGGEGEPDDP